MTAYLSPVANRGCPPESFVRELCAALAALPDEVFAPNDVFDAYSSVVAALGPYVDLPYRRACMAEILRVLAGFESSWNWHCGRDENNPASNRPETTEAGAFQVSADSRGFGADLRSLAPADGAEFQRAMKADHRLAVEYAARLLRHTVNHNGPVKRHEIDPWLRRDSVAELTALMAAPRTVSDGEAVA